MRTEHLHLILEQNHEVLDLEDVPIANLLHELRALVHKQASKVQRHHSKQLCLTLPCVPSESSSNSFSEFTTTPKPLMLHCKAVSCSTEQDAYLIGVDRFGQLREFSVRLQREQILRRGEQIQTKQTHET
mgnify:CR=1 FL=1